jgi:hypothetical protein
MKNLKVEKNRCIQITMEPADAIDAAVLEAMAAAARDNPAAVKLVYADGVATISVEAR